MGKLKKLEQYTPDELQHAFTQMVGDIEAKMIESGKPTPTTMQDIPALFEGLTRYTAAKPEVARDAEGEIVWRDADLGIKTPEVIKTALWIARKYNLVPDDTPLRQIWYSFIKLALQKAVTDVASADQLFSKRTLELIRDAGLWYSDFNIKNEPVAFDTPKFDDYDLEKDVQIIPNTIIAMEKESYYQYLKNFADLLGAANYSAGGMSQGTLAETVVKRLDDVFPKEDFKMYSVTDYDPAGLNISYNLGKHFNLFGNRLGLNFTAERTAPKPEHYTPTELSVGLYNLTGKSKPEEQERWTQPDKIAERALYNIDDKQGMEVESLPAMPLPEQYPTGMDASDVVGQARMRLILLQKIIDDLGGASGLDFGLENLMGDGFYPDPDSKAESIISENAGLNQMEQVRSMVYWKVNTLKEIMKTALQDEINEVEEKLTEWRDDTIDDWINDTDKLEDLEDDLKRATIRNQTQSSLRNVYSRKYPSIPERISEWEIATGMRTKIDMYKGKVDDIIAELDDIIEEARDDFGVEE
ncbi:MAG: hypothetical protein GY870_12540 [archaeon]|nr:hypothetical protein [archaeon]